MNGNLLLAALSLIGTTAYLLVFVSLHALPTGYNPVRNAVSDYAVGKYGTLFRIGLWFSAFGVLTLTFAMRRAVGSPPLPRVVSLYLGLIVATRIGMSLFHTDLEGAPVTRRGIVHYAFAIAAFTFTYLAISKSTPVLRDLDPSSWRRTALRWSAAAVLPELAVVVLTMFRPLRRVFGLVERIFLITTNIWFIIVGLLIIKLVR